MSVSRISKILIANRGEIACRIAKTAKRMGIETVAVYSEADRNALHVKLADEARCIGPASSQQSYLRAEKLLEVAEETNSQAIHPGYGFLSENLEFAGLCKSRNIIFIGPPESAIRDMGIKNTSKSIMEAAGVPVVRGYLGEDQDKKVLLKEAIKIGFPVMIKAIRGGGGKGMRISMSESDFCEQLDSAKRESLKSFNDDNVLLEKFIDTPRHVEVQVFGDTHGNYIHLCERDCSVQRRHQKIIEEAPGPHITPEIRDRLGQAAVRAAAAVNYVGAGTVEFIMDAEHSFFFMEMNTRLQVEHPITEMITGLDLVEWQIRVADGEPLPITDQRLISPRGHAFEARIYAEDCEDPDAFLPAAGRITGMRTPASSQGLVRIDSGVEEGDLISVHYDPMIAKLVVWAEDRTRALHRLRTALRAYEVVGVPTNIGLLQAVAAHEAFLAGKVHTGFIAQHRAGLFAPGLPSGLDFCVAAVALVLIDESPPGCDYRPEDGEDRYSPFGTGLAAFRVNCAPRRRLKLRLGTAEAEVTVEGRGSLTVSSSLSADSWTVTGSLSRDGTRHLLHLEVGGVSRTVSVFRDSLDVHLFEGGRHRVFRLAGRAAGTLQGPAEDSSGGAAVSPMPGVVEKVLVAEGAVVVRGDALVTVMAMKMEYSVRAAVGGVVRAVHVAEGDTVAKGAALVDVDPA